jgi:chemotaxis protein histidine kinase CheA
MLRHILFRFVRDAMDHDIEAAETRIAKSKAAEGSPSV